MEKSKETDLYVQRERLKIEDTKVSKRTDLGVGLILLLYFVSLTRSESVVSLGNKAKETGFSIQKRVPKVTDTITVVMMSSIEVFTPTTFFYFLFVDPKRGCERPHVLREGNQRTSLPLPEETQNDRHGQCVKTVTPMGT